MSTCYKVHQGQSMWVTTTDHKKGNNYTRRFGTNVGRSFTVQMFEWIDLAYGVHFKTSSELRRRCQLKRKGIRSQAKQHCRSLKSLSLIKNLCHLHTKWHQIIEKAVSDQTSPVSDEMASEQPKRHNLTTFRQKHIRF